ncbi:hypothetical protein Cflav_PD0941 [Pedosphaera parvula Ellin514]|uniref:Uncharacterized protein n=1 Tax=Pedosphaera parvula (strain Ellin514) TaxID=320771 RepID=B9XQM7_PEDPL|nr:hypothetical protein Cflav_PD0941 [Pedosphaera parvula Ellin514]
MYEQYKLERFPTALALNHVYTSTQNQAFNAILFFCKRCRYHEAENAKGATCVNTLVLLLHAKPNRLNPLPKDRVVFLRVQG